MEGITAGFVGELTPWSLLLLVVVFFMLGWIRPRSAITEVRQSYEVLVAELRQDRDSWREAHRVSEEVRVTQREAIRDALEVAKLSQESMRDVRLASAVSDRDRRPSGPGGGP